MKIQLFNKNILTLFISSLIITTFSSCGPNAENVSAPSAPLKTEVTVLSFEEFGNYEETSDLFSFFVWPKDDELQYLAKELKRDQLKIQDVTVQMGRESTRLDHLYVARSEVIKSLKKLQLERDHSKPKFFFERLYKNYTCYVGESSDKCIRAAQSEDKPETLATPTKCADLGKKPWLSLYKDDRKTCKNEEDALEEPFNQASIQITKSIEELENKKATIEEDSWKFMTGIPIIVDGKNDALGNWIKTEQQKSFFIHHEGIKAPEMTLVFTLNNSTHPKNTDEAPSIVDTKLVMEKNTPHLKFTILEKRFVDEEEGRIIDEFTGNYYTASLARSIQPYGLLFLGEVHKYNADNEKIDKGLMKIIFLEK